MTGDQVENATYELALSLRTQWDEEARRRHIQESHQMPVRWERTYVPAHAARNRDSELSDTGELQTLIEAYAADPFRMIVTGDPGSGKSALCVGLVLEFLHKRAPERVPLLLQISSWNPTVETLTAWMIRKLSEEHPYLVNESIYGPAAPRTLLEQDRILPILDGLDEMPDALRTNALQAIGRDLPSSGPFILTCRTDEFNAIRRGDLLRSSSIIQLLPVSAAAATAYLSDTPFAEVREQWSPVLTRLVEDPSGPLATVLTKPLMLYLARTIYDQEDADPRQFLENNEFSNARQIEEHLLDGFVPSLYSSRPPTPTRYPHGPERRRSAAKAEHWLTCLALHLQSLETRDLAWWQLHILVPRHLFIITGGIVGGVWSGVMGGVFFGMFGRPVFGAVVGLLVGVTSGTIFRSMSQGSPRQFVGYLRFGRLLESGIMARDLGFGIVGGFVGLLVVGIVFGPLYGVMIGIILGITYSLSHRITEPTEPTEALSPRSTLRSDRAVVIYSALLGGIIGIMVGIFLGGVVGVEDRGLIISTSNRLQEGLIAAAGGGLMGAGGLGMMVYGTGAWSRLTSTRVWLAFKGSAPLRLMTFLEEARHLGILRQVGPYYQFRHALLQDRLIARSRRNSD